MKTSGHKITAAWLIGILLVGVAMPADVIGANPALPIERNWSRGVSRQDEEQRSLLHAYKRAKLSDATQLSFSSQDQLLAVDGDTFDELGLSVAISADTAIIGAPFHKIGTNANQGSAYVFTRSGPTWSQQAKLIASDGGANDGLGYSVAISDNTAIVGAPFDDIGSNDQQGSAYIFVRAGGGTTWTQQAKLTAADGAVGDRFGFDVGISGLTVVITAYLDDNGSVDDQGSAYVFVRSIATPIWSFQQKLIFIDGASDDNFGYSVAISGSTVIVGVPFDDIGSNLLQGSACIFVRSGTTWTQQARIVANDGAADDTLAFDVAISGNTAVVGAPANPPLTTRPGSAYVFVRSGSIWTQQAKLVVSDIDGNDLFGSSVAVSSEEVIVGAYRDGPGSAYIFTRSSTSWAQKAKLIDSRVSVPGSDFGKSVAISPGIAIVGSPHFSNSRGIATVFISVTPFDFDGDARTDIGIFRPGPAEWWIDRSSTGVASTSQFGSASDKIVPADFTGDGKTDIAVFRPSTGFWFVLRSEDNSFFSFPFGTDGDVPVPFSFDADAQAEPVVFRPSTGTWFITEFLVSNQTIAIQWGGNGDIPVPGDFTNEGKPSIAIYRPSNGQWWIRRDSPQGGNLVVSFGTGSDKPVPGDYTGDGIADAAFFRPSTAEWFILRSQDFSFFSFPFGTSGDIPAPGDYDGDGKFDAAVFRPSSGSWFISRSIGGLTVKQFGISGDRPIPSAFVP